MNPRDFEALLRANSARALNAIMAAAERIMRAPLKYGAAPTIENGRPHLLDTIKPGLATPDNLTAEAGSDSPIAIFREQDTAPHVIVPRDARVLKFVSQGQTIFSTRVWHPGTKGTHSRQLAAAFVEEHLPRLLEEAADAALEGRSYVPPSPAELAGGAGNRLV